MQTAVYGTVTLRVQPPSAAHPSLLLCRDGWHCQSAATGNAGLQDYAEVMYGEAHKKPLPRDFVRFRSEYLADPAEEDVPYNELRGNTPQKIVHGKYPWTMQILRDRIGDGPFRRGIRLLFHRYRFRTFSIEEYIQIFEQTSRQPLKWWREQWLERKGVPELAFKYSVVPDEKQYRINCRISQQGEVYELPLEIGIKTAKTLRIERTVLRSRAAEVTFNSADPPIDVELDPNNRILMKKAGM